MSNALPINRLVNVSVNLSPSAAQMQDISTLLVLGSTANVIDVVERFRNYTSIDQVSADFGSSAAEYLAALLWFEQVPQPSVLQIGRWAKLDTAGTLRCAPLSAVQQLIATWTAITTGAFKVTVDGVLKSLTALDFHLQTNLNGVASVIQTALAGSATCVWNSVYSRFEFTSATTGAASTVSFLAAPSAGVDISGMLAGLSTSSGAYVAEGIVAETALTAVTLFDQNYGQGWYGLTVLGAADADHLAIAPYIEAATAKHIYGVSTQAAGVISSVSTTDIAYLLKALLYKRTVVQYSSSNAYAVCSLLGRILTVDYNGNNTVITLMYKQEPGIVAETLNVSQITALESKNCNVFVAYNNDTAIIEPGVVSSGDFLDIITGTDWLALDTQIAVYNLLYTTSTKVPQSDQGNNLIVATIETECSRAAANGLLAAGTWQAAGFGSLAQNDFLPKGFYVYAPPIALQSASDRAARKSVSIRVAAKLAGAIHTVDILINVNR